MLGTRDNPPYYITAYALACRKGFRGTEEEWLASLKGGPGNTGKSAYEYAVEGGFQGSEDQFREQQAHSGKNAYDYAVEGGYTGTVQEFSEKLAKEYLPKDGGSMAGELSMGRNRVTGLGAPQEDSDAARKQDVDAVGTLAAEGKTLAAEGKTLAEKALPKTGGAMTGPIAMGGSRVTGLGTPTDAGDASTKSYVDGKHLLATVSLPAADWVGDAAPYTQTVAVPGILETDTPHYGVVYSGTAEEKASRKEGFSLVDDLDTAAGSVTFTCFEEKPAVDLTVQLEVNR